MLQQIVATKANGKCPVALTEFTADSEVLLDQLDEFKKHGHPRERSHPNLRIYDFNGRDVVGNKKPKSKTK